MNLQALMKQAQSMQKNMMESKKKIDNMIFKGNSELVEVEINGKREVLLVKIKTEENLDKDDIEILQDMIVIAMNDALKKVNEEINKKLGSQAGTLGGLI